METTRMPSPISAPSWSRRGGAVSSPDANFQRRRSYAAFVPSSE